MNFSLTNKSTLSNMHTHNIMRHLSLLLAVAAIAASCGNKKGASPTDTQQQSTGSQPEAYVDTMHLHRQAFCRQTVCNGQLRARAKSRLAFAADGIVTRIYVAEGQRVARGAVVATLDRRDKMREVERAEREVERARVALADKLISLGYDATMKGVPADVMRRAEVTSGYSTARYALQSARAALDDCTLRAPFAGRIADVVGREYQRNDVICTLIDDAQMEVEFKVLEAELPRIKTGQAVTVSPFADDREQCRGTVTHINPTVDSQGMVRVTARIDNTGTRGTLIDGMNVRIVLEQRVGGMFVVPKEAVVERDGWHVVFMYRDGRAVWTYVDILHSNMRSYAIAGCARKATVIGEGDAVITSGNLNLADDTAVKISKAH